MKLLHTADWHLNDRLGRTDRTEHLRRRVETVATICEHEAVDVLVLAGDLFSEQAEVSSRANQVADSFRHLRQTFAAFFARGGIILGVTGNHDQDGRVRPQLELARAGMDLAEPPRRRGDHFEPRKMYLLDTAFVGRVRDAREGFDVQFALLPYPGLGRVLTGGETATTPAELNRPVGEYVAGWIRALPELPGYDAALRTVLVAHLNVTGADVNRGLLRIDERSDVVLDAAALPQGFDYVALGHVHKPQCIRGLTHIRYAGSLDRMDFGDTDAAKEVVLVDIGPDGRRGVIPIAIEPTRLEVVTITDPGAAAEEIAAQVPDPGASVVRVVVEPAAADAGTAVDLAIRSALPNVAAVEWRSPELADGPAARTAPTGSSVRERVLNYLADHAAPEDRDQLLALAATFLDQEGHP
jgi:exonuclease SbcD